MIFQIHKYQIIQKHQKQNFKPLLDSKIQQAGFHSSFYFQQQLIIFY